MRFTILNLTYVSPILRFYLLNGHYRSPIDFSDDNLEESMSAYRRLEGSYTRLLEIKSQGSDRPSDLISAIKNCKNNFVTAMNDDFNTREAIAALFQLSRISNNYDYSVIDTVVLNEVIGTFELYGNKVLGLFSVDALDSKLESEIEKLISDRDKARKSKDWTKSDLIRDKLMSMSIEIQDTPDGTKWRKI